MLEMFIRNVESSDPVEFKHWLFAQTGSLGSTLVYETMHGHSLCCKINFLVGPLEPFPATLKRWKLAWFRRVMPHDSLPQGTLEGGRCCGRQRKRWMDNIKVDVPACARTADDGLLQKRLEEGLFWIIPHVPATAQSVKGLSWTFISDWSLARFQVRVTD